MLAVDTFDFWLVIFLVLVPPRAVDSFAFDNLDVAVDLVFLSVKGVHSWSSLEWFCKMAM